MQKAARQEPTSDEILIAVYQSLLRYWIKQQVPKEKAEDLAQEGLLKCLLKAHKWKGTASLKTFLTVRTPGATSCAKKHDRSGSNSETLR